MLIFDGRISKHINPFGAGTYVAGPKGVNTAVNFIKMVAPQPKPK